MSIDNREDDEAFAPKDLGFSLLRTRGGTIKWYLTAHWPWSIAAVVLVAGGIHFSGGSPTSTRPPVTTTTTRPVTTTTRPQVTTTTTTQPVTTTTRPQVTTTTRPVTTYSVSFACSGGQQVTVSGTGADSANRLNVDGPGGFKDSGAGTTASVSFVAKPGTYHATDFDRSGHVYVNWASGPGCSQQ